MFLFVKEPEETGAKEVESIEYDEDEKKSIQDDLGGET